jgi:hypothetical protein
LLLGIADGKVEGDAARETQVLRSSSLYILYSMATDERIIYRHSIGKYKGMRAGEDQKLKSPRISYFLDIFEFNVVN